MNYQQSAEYIKQRLSQTGHPIPEIAIVLGSGLGKLADNITNPLVIPYSDIPFFKQSTAVGHKGNLIFGTLGDTPVMAMQGRFHYYEGYTMQEVTYPIRVFSLLGIKLLMVSNAAGAMNPDYKVGDLMVITDHINFMPNPLIGPNLEQFGTRFPDMTEAYSHRMCRLADQAASELGITLQHGVYVAETGPTYETPAEYRMFRLMGGDAVGMSTVPEVIVARHCGIEVFGMSVITNQANDLGDDIKNDGDDVVRAADAAADRMTALFKRLIETSTKPQSTQS
ncbi:MAG: purine nucleoside phosphorylase I, inosine and guanosine-specific [Bacteroidales bacterium]|nr:purine nucleoside phosphorylase I, inosine and guanosine-specific [Bacteroidales bacterium]